MKTLTCEECDSTYKVSRATRCRDGKYRCNACVQRRRWTNYNKSEKRKTVSRRYTTSPRGRSVISHNVKLWQKTKKGKEAYKRYITSDKGRIAKRRVGQARKARVRASGEITSSIVQQVESKYKRCVICTTQSQLTLDHVVPISKGGTNNIHNLIMLCSPCNSFKYNRILLQDGETLMRV